MRVDASSDFFQYTSSYLLVKRTSSNINFASSHQHSNQLTTITVGFSLLLWVNDSSSGVLFILLFCYYCVLTVEVESFGSLVVYMEGKGWRILEGRAFL